MKTEGADNVERDQDTVLSEEELKEAAAIAGRPVDEIGIETVATRDVLRSLPIRKFRETYRIPIDILKPRPGFNVREDYGDITELADGILASGFRTSPLEVDVLTDGYAYIIDGHRRYQAFLLLRSRGYSINEVECFINERGVTEEERIVSMFTTQNNQQLRPLEIAACLMRLQHKNWTIKRIADRIGKSERYVKKYLRIDRQPAVIKEMVENGVLGIDAVEDIAAAFPNEDERAAYVEQNIVPQAASGEKAVVIKKGTTAFIATRLKRLEELDGLFASATRNKIEKVIRYLKGELDEVDLVNL